MSLTSRLYVLNQTCYHLIAVMFYVSSEAITQKNGKNSWLHALQKCASRSQSVLKKLKLDLFGQEADDYDSLDSSQRLRLLVFLCDEVLCTA